MLLVQQILSKNFPCLVLLLNVSAREHSFLLDVLYPYLANIFFCPENVVCFLQCCIHVYSRALQINFNIEANTMNPDQTAPK